MSVSICMYMYNIQAWWQWKVEDNVGSPKTGVANTPQVLGTEQGSSGRAASAHNCYPALLLVCFKIRSPGKNAIQYIASFNKK